MKDFISEFNEKLELILKNSSKDLLGINMGTLSDKSLLSIAKYSIGETLKEEVIKYVGQYVRENLIQILDEAFKYVRQTRSSNLKVEHVMFAMKEHGYNLNMLHIDYDVNSESEEIEEDVPTPTIKKETEILKSPEPLSKDDKGISIPKEISRPWVNREQVLLLPNHKFPLSKEQQERYVQITESIMGTSETLREKALDCVQADSSLQPMLSVLCVFIAENVKFNIVAHNIYQLSFLLRLTKSLLNNTKIRLHNYLHLLIPSVISCVVANQICSHPIVENHWDLRAYASNISVEIAKKFDSKQNKILSKSITLYKNGLQSSSLSTIYGCILGLNKMGNYTFREFIIPQLSVISKRIEPFLKDSPTKDILNNQAAKKIGYLLQIMCTPILITIHTPTDKVQDYVQRYGFLGNLLYESVKNKNFIIEAYEDAFEYVSSNK